MQLISKYQPITGIYYSELIESLSSLKGILPKNDLYFLRKRLDYVICALVNISNITGLKKQKHALTDLIRTESMLNECVECLNLISKLKLADTRQLIDRVHSISCTLSAIKAGQFN